ncbi:MAG: glycosyltransferase [Thermoplasmatota archaeon]
MKILVIPTTDWIGHPVPNRLNFIFDRLANEHEIDVCHFKIFNSEMRNTKCNLIDIDKEVNKDIGRYYLSNSLNHLNKISNIADAYDVIVSSNIIPGLWANLNDTPVIVDYLDHFPQSASSYYSPPMNELVKYTGGLITNLNLKGASAIITPTEKFKEYLKGKTDKNIYVVPNGVDTDLIHPSDPTDIEEIYSLEHPVLGYAGSLEKWIDLESIIELMPTLIRRYPKIKLLIVGPGLHTNYASKLERLAVEKRVDDRVIFTGGVKYSELAPYISAMDVGLNPRKKIAMNKLTFGSKVLNYLSCGVPVLSKNMPTVEEIFGKEKGVFTYSDDEEFLGKLVLAFNKNINPAWIGKFDWDILSEKYEQVIQDVFR